MRSSPSQHNTKIKVARISLMILGVIAVIAVALFFFLPMENRKGQQADYSIDQTKPLKQQAPADKKKISEDTSTVEGKETGTQQQKQKTLQTSPPEQKQEVINQVPPLHAPSKLTCNESADKLDHFFQNLNEKEYVQAFSLQVSVKEHFLNLTRQLLDNPPVVSRETDDLYTLLTNMAHFFRIIGKDNIVLIKTILGRERDQIEDIAQYLYTTLSKTSCARQQYQLHAPVEKMYEYAAFFLNTMGGRSYLFRRESRSRLLVNYYAVLIIEKSNELELNYHGINLNDYLPFLIREIESSNQLVYKEMYLDTLYALLEAYQ